jgi:hypothetical protein
MVAAKRKIGTIRRTNIMKGAAVSQRLAQAGTAPESFLGVLTASICRYRIPKNTVSITFRSSTQDVLLKSSQRAKGGITIQRGDCLTFEFNGLGGKTLYFKGKRRDKIEVLRTTKSEKWAT